MFNETTSAKLEFALKMINDIELILNRHNGTDNALSDVEGYNALLMCLMQIGESLSKIKENKASDLLPVNVAYKMRNIIAHDYMGVNLNVVKDTLQKDIPELKKVIEKILINNN